MWVILVNYKKLSKTFDRFSGSAICLLHGVMPLYVIMNLSRLHQYYNILTDNERYKLLLSIKPKKIRFMLMTDL